MDYFKRDSTNEDIKINSNKALSYIHFIWHLIGIYPLSTRNSCIRFLYRSYSYLVIGFCFIFMPLTMLIQLFFIENIKEISENLSVSVSLVIATCKLFVIYSYRGPLLQGRDFLTKLDARCNKNAKDQQYLRNAVQLCHRIAIIFIFWYLIVSSSYAYGYYRKNQLMYGDWFSNLFKQSAFANYHFTFGYHLLSQKYVLLQNVSNDGYSSSYLVVMIAQLRALRARISRIGMEPKVSAESNFKELLSCIQDHKLILGYFDCIRSPISRTIFFQFLIMGFVLCLIAINFLLFDRDNSQLLFTVSYLVAVVIQAFPCCWFVNELMTESYQLTTAMYCCKWYEQDQRFKKTLIIFMQRSQKTIVIMAGNLAPVTLQTFLSIIRFSFSMFTILNKMNI